MVQQTEDERRLMAEEYDRVLVMDAGLGVIRELRDKGPLHIVLIKARDDARVAVEELVKCNPFDANQVRELQWAATRYAALHTYVAEIIEAGRAASDDLTDEQRFDTEKLINGDDNSAKDE